MGIQLEEEIDRLEAELTECQRHKSEYFTALEQCIKERERLRAELIAAQSELATQQAELVTAHNDALEKAEDAMLGVFADMDRAYLFTSGFDSRIIDARDAIRSLKK